MEDPSTQPVRILAIAESDAYVKWAAWTLQRLPVGFAAEVIVLRSPTAPSRAQVATALTGTRLEGTQLTQVGIASLRRHLRRCRPDVVLVACTGPTVAVVSSIVATFRRRPVVVSGLPGVGLPVRERAIRARRKTDVFIAHSRREVMEYQAAFDVLGVRTTVALSTLPFLAESGGSTVGVGGGGGGSIVFAAQPSVPEDRCEREQILLALSQLGPPSPIVKLRGRQGDAMTHDEPWPYPVLWSELRRSGRVADERVRFVDGPIASALEAARCLVTVSSTAAIEAIAMGVPVLAIDDFGVRPELLNEVFIGSGLLAGLTADEVDEASLPAPEWLADNYFHDRTDDDWVAVVRAHVASPMRRHWRTDARFVVTVARRLVRLGTAHRTAASDGGPG